MKINCFLLFILSIIIGCLETSPDVEEKKPPYFSFLEIHVDSNDVSPEYISRMIGYDELIAASTCPVYIMGIKDLPETFHSTFVASNNLAGSYHHNRYVKGWPTDFIFIKKISDPYAMMSTYFHELGHRRCDLLDCFCYKQTDRAIRERHAFQNEIRMAIDKEDIFILATVLRILESRLKYSDDTDVYKIAAKTTQKSEIWKEAIEYIEFVLTYSTTFSECSNN